MATTRSKPADTSPATPAADDNTAPQGERESLSMLLSELAGNTGAQVTVYRATPNQPQAYMFRCSPDAFSLDDLRDKYNGGEFRAYIARDGVLWKNVRVVVEPRAAAGGAAPEAPGGLAELAALMREGFDRQAASVQMIVQARAPAPAPAPSVLGNIDLPATITAIAAAMTALRPPPAPPPPPERDGSKGAIDMLLKGIELARELRSDSGGASEEPSLMGMLRDLVRSPILAQAVAAATAPSTAAPARVAPAPVARPALPAPVGANGATHAPLGPPPATGTVETPAMFKHYLGILVAKAQQESDPAVYADVILDSVDEAALQSLLARPPDAVSALIVDCPAIAQHRPWFESLVSILRGALDASDADVIQGGNVEFTDAIDNAEAQLPGSASPG